MTKKAIKKEIEKAFLHCSKNVVEKVHWIFLKEKALAGQGSFVIKNYTKLTKDDYIKNIVENADENDIKYIYAYLQDITN